jgi:hypothetical protein
MLEASDFDNSVREHPLLKRSLLSPHPFSQPRAILLCPSLVKYVPLEAMQDRPVIVLCNLKPRNMRGIKSNGMLLAASNAEHTEVEPLVPAAGAAPGSRVWWGQHTEQVRRRGAVGAEGTC